MAYTLNNITILWFEYEKRANGIIGISIMPILGISVQQMNVAAAAVIMVIDENMLVWYTIL